MAALARLSAGLLLALALTLVHTPSQAAQNALSSAIPGLYRAHSFHGTRQGSHTGGDAPIAQQLQEQLQHVLSSSMAATLLAAQQRHPRMHNELERVPVRSVVASTDAGIHLAVNREQLADGAGEWFEVAWSGVPDPSYEDWVALVVPADADLSRTAPAKWKYAAASDTHVTKGAGTLRFRLISYFGHDMAFVFMRGGFSKPVEVARSAPIKVLHPQQPLYLRLALTGRPGEMQVQWTTRCAGSAPEVRWGDGAGGPYHGRAAASAITYGPEDMCGEPATTIGYVDSGVHHVAVMTGLQPGRRYFYTVGDEASGWSKERSFVAAPAPGPGSTVKVLAVADMGQGEPDGSLEGSEMMPSLNTTGRMEIDCPDCTLLVHNGDISYARGYATQWANFLSQIEPLAGRLPYMMAVGNHERDWPGSGDMFGVLDSGGECGVPYERLFNMPYPGRDKHWYSFDYGPIHFLQYSTEHELRPGSEQHTFIAADLAAVDRAATPWLVVGGHRPPYIASTNTMAPDGDQPVAQLLRASLEELLLQHRVDVTLHGHHHSYQRTCPVFQERCMGYDEDSVPRAPVHLVIGHAGAGLSVNIADPPEWLQVLRLWWGYMRMEVNETMMRIEVVSDESGELMDSLVLRKPQGWGRQFMDGRHASAFAKQ